MKTESIVSIIMCLIACGGILVFIGRSLATLTNIGDAVKLALAKTDRHETDIARIDKELTCVKTRQESCGSCP